jgi:solute:Na+ symporter, SSS family
MVNDHVPHAFRGIIMAGFLAAFMSTIATQLNWGSSYIVEDFYRRFLVRGATERHYVLVSQITTILLVFATGYVSAQLASIRSGWQVVLQVGAGTGSVYMLRWYWWRINAWSEISAMATALLATIIFNSQSLAQALVGRPTLFTGSDTVLFAKNVLATTALTTAVWVAVTFLTAQEPNAILISFYRKVLPDVTGWKPIAALTPDIAATHDLARNLWCWLLGTVMVYSALFGVGKLLFHAYPLGAALVALSTLCAWRMHHELQLPSTH